MYFWNTRALAHELAQQTLSKRHYKNYYLAAALVVTAVYYYGMYSPYLDGRVILTEAVLTLLIMVVGIQRAYAANGGDQGDHFINRITALSFPILVQTTVAGVVFGLILLAFYQFSETAQQHLATSYEWCISAFTLFLQLLFFVRLVHYMKRVKNSTV